MSIHALKLSFETLSESALLIQLEQRIDPAINARVHELCHSLAEAALPGVREIMPAYASALVHFDPEPWAEEGEADAHETLIEAIRRCLKEGVVSEPDARASRMHQLPMCYGGHYGEDLEAVAKHCGLTPEQVIGRHCAVEYRVAMLGFAPGFAYLLGLDPALEIPRRDKPRTQVPAGSVGIGGAQTGIYPRQLPGGWQLLGRTPERLFDAGNETRPSLLQPGDRVRFAAINEDEFLKRAGDLNA